MKKSIGIGCLLSLMSLSAYGAEKITFWHSMGGAAGESLNHFVREFNQKQNQYEVESVYQGNYVDALNKYKNTLGSRETPNIMMNDSSARYLIESGTIEPLHTIIEKDDFSLEDFQKSALNYYSYQDKLYSMPFALSTAVLFYNQSAFKDAGIEEIPKSFAEVEEVSKKLVIKNGNQVERYGFVFSVNPWRYFEQMLSNENQNYVNADNGRTGLPTEVQVNNKAGKNILGWIDTMMKSGSSTYYKNNSDIGAAFLSGKATMFIGGSNLLNDTPEFGLGAAFLPNSTGKFNGSLVGGNSLWITKASSEDQKKGAWEFLKYLVTPEVQAKWALDTGYIAVVNSAYEQPNLKDAVTKNPNLLVGKNQLEATNQDYPTAGALLGNFPEIRKHSELGLEKIFNQATSVENVLKEISDKSNRDIKRYNSLNRK